MTVLWNLGERLADRVIKAQPAATTGPITNGEPLDSGTAMLAASNLSHICREGARNLVQSPGLGPTGVVTSYQNDGALFNTLSDAGFTFTGENVGWVEEAMIPWDPRCAEAFPAQIICDRQNSTGRVTLRSIRYSFDITSDAGNSAQSFLIAITTHCSPRRLMNGDHLAFDFGAFGGTGNRIVTGTLSSDIPWHPALLGEWPCRGATYADGARTSFPLEVYIWFGWKFVGAGTGNAINGLSAWESRIDPA